LLSKYPRLRIAFSHGGGTFASLLPRLEQGATLFPALKDSLVEPPSVTARRIYVDSLVFDKDMLQRLVSVFGEERVLIGTDYPFNFREPDPIGTLEAAFADPALQERLIATNALKFLALDKVSAHEHISRDSTPQR
jgi:aminocarboxymuconate-semialdehyde decarboxylase